MKKALRISTIISVLLFIVFFIAYKFTDNVVLYSLYITFLTFSYHFLMRLAVGHLPIFKSDFDYKSKWFQPKKFEKKLYNFLKVKSWKKHIPAYYPEAFDTKHNTLEQIVKNMCNAEVVHEKIAVLSFVPILFSIKFGVPSVFIITSIIACMFDMVFVVVQRYNRPRVVKLLDKQNN